MPFSGFYEKPTARGTGSWSNFDTQQNLLSLMGGLLMIAATRSKVFMIVAMVSTIGVLFG